MLLVTVLFLAPYFPVIRMPDGDWLFARTSGRVELDGRGYRSYVWGVDALIRVEIDSDGDGDWDLRGDDWQSELPRWC